MADSENETPHISDELWEQIYPLLPPEPPQQRGSRLRMDSRKAMEAIFDVLRSGDGWDDIAGESPLSERFQKWCLTGVFDRLWQVGILTYEELKTLVQFSR